MQVGPRGDENLTLFLFLISLLLNSCVGFAVSRKFENLTPDDEQRMMNLNYFGSVWTTRAALPSMKEAGGGGTVVFVASQGSLVGLYGMTAYCGSKFAIRGFAESLAMGESLIIKAQAPNILIII